MTQTYHDLFRESHGWPLADFHLELHDLAFHGVNLSRLVEAYGTPLKITYLPRIGEQIRKARSLFQEAFQKYDYSGSYVYCYCTKCNHFSHVVEKVLTEGGHLETSSTMDIELIFKMYDGGFLGKNTNILHNGHKTPDYLENIGRLISAGFTNSIIILDSKSELSKLKTILHRLNRPLNIGIRMAAEETDNTAYRTSRLGLRADEVIEFYAKEIQDHENFRLKMLHFFVDSGIKDDDSYWKELQKALGIYTALRSLSPSLDSFNIGGGFPIMDRLDFQYDYRKIVDSIVARIVRACEHSNVPEPDLYTEFGKYTVGESGALIFQVVAEKQQNQEEKWYLINSSLMNTLPDMWSASENFILLPVNRWGNTATKAFVGGISCDRADYYGTNDAATSALLPQYSDKETLLLGFFHTGAYQDSISGYGGVKHCLIPNPTHVVIDRNKDGELEETLFSKSNTPEEVLKILGYEG